MNAKRINEAEVAPLRVASLPTRPTSGTSYGGRGYTAGEMKAAFDKLPELLIKRYNALLSDIYDGSLANEMSTGLYYPATLGEILQAMDTGTLCDLIFIDGLTLRHHLELLQLEIEKLKGEKS